MAVKMSDIAVKVQAAVDAINEQINKHLLGEPLMDRGQPNVMIICGGISYSVAINKREVDNAGALIKKRLIVSLLDVKHLLEYDLKKLGYVEPQIEHIQEL